MSSNGHHHHHSSGSAHPHHPPLIHAATASLGGLKSSVTAVVSSNGTGANGIADSHVHHHYPGVHGRPVLRSPSAPVGLHLPGHGHNHSSHAQALPTPSIISPTPSPLPVVATPTPHVHHNHNHQHQHQHHHHHHNQSASTLMPPPPPPRLSIATSDISSPVIGSPAASPNPPGSTQAQQAARAGHVPWLHGRTQSMGGSTGGPLLHSPIPPSVAALAATMSPTAHMATGMAISTGSAITPTNSAIGLSTSLSSAQLVGNGTNVPTPLSSGPITPGSGSHAATAPAALTGTGTAHELHKSSSRSAMLTHRSSILAMVPGTKLEANNKSLLLAGMKFLVHTPKGLFRHKPKERYVWCSSDLSQVKIAKIKGDMPGRYPSPLLGPRLTHCDICDEHRSKSFACPTIR
jgi:hypothetical protein